MINEFNQVLSVIIIVLFFINVFVKNNNKDVFLITFISNGIGIIYYAYGGELYRKPSDLSIQYMLYIILLVNFICLIYSMYFYKIGINRFDSRNVVLKQNKLVMYMLLIFFMAPLYYFIIFFDKFPIYYMILGEVIGEGFRPDISGNIPMFYTFSVFLGSFTIPFLIQLYIIENKKNAKFFIIVVLLFLAIVSGDKSTLLIIVFYLSFIYGKVKLSKILIFGLFFIFFYLSVKFFYYQELTYSNTYEIFESFFRRICLIGPATFGTYIDYFILDNGTIPNEFSHIKQFLFYLIYGYKEGGAPVYFPVSFLDIIGIGFFQILFIGCLFLIILILRNIILKTYFGFFSESIKYLHFYGAIILAQGMLSDLFIRWFIPVICILILDKILILIMFKFNKKRVNERFSFNNNPII